jgi:hypothetical protein
MEKKSLLVELQEPNQYHLRMLPHLEMLKMRSRTLFVMALSLDFKLVYKTLTIYFRHTLVSLLLLLVSLLQGSRILWIKWLSDTILTMAGKQLLHLRKISQHILHAHKLMRKTWQGMPTKEDIGGDKWNQIADHCNTNYFHIDMERYTLESVLRKGAELVKRKGIKCLVIDPFNKVRD